MGAFETKMTLRVDLQNLSQQIIKKQTTQMFYGYQLKELLKRI
ncbi:hypothetical protein SAMN05216524_1011239 [Mucilaginibacter sp. OK098]|nr:hypothetical protein SAMN05216524_1011239 [Mucilaginibacter sp. OK098]